MLIALVARARGGPGETDSGFPVSQAWHKLSNMVWVASVQSRGGGAASEFRETSTRSPILSTVPRGSKQLLSRTQDRTSKRRKLGVSGIGGALGGGGQGQGQGQLTPSTNALNCPRCGGGLGPCTGDRSCRCASAAPALKPGLSITVKEAPGPRKAAKLRGNAMCNNAITTQMAVCSLGGRAKAGEAPRSHDESLHLSPASIFSEDELRRHLVALKTEFIQRAMRPILSKLMIHIANKGVFNQRVDAEALGLLDYAAIIKQPMDLGTVKSRLQSLYYLDMHSFAEDVRLVFSNARK
jgi:hypothetical protein